MNNLKIFFILIPLVVLLFACSSKMEKNQATTQQASTKEVVQNTSSNQKLEIVDNEKVCMVNDKFMSVKQIPIAVDGITYYGCCQNCVKKIQDNLEGVRYSKDPISGKKVDKASAIIVQNKEDGTVQYFESKASAQDYMKQ